MCVGVCEKDRGEKKEKRREIETDKGYEGERNKKRAKERCEINERSRER